MSKLIELTQGKQAIVDDEDFEWLNQWKWYAHKDKKTWYARRSYGPRIERKSINMHTFIMGLNQGQKVDHRNNNGLDNRRDNLRECTNSQNATNSTKRKGNFTSRYKGVSWDKRDKNWRAQIMVDYKKKRIGNFDNEIDAAKAYDRFAIELHGEYASINFPVRMTT